MREFSIFKTSHALYHLMEAHPCCLVYGPELYLIQESLRLATKISQNNKKNLDICLYFHFISLFLGSIITKMIIKSEKNKTKQNTITIT